VAHSQQTSGVYVEDGRIDEFAASIQRVETRQNGFEVAIARLDTKLDGIQATLITLTQSFTGLDVRLGQAERSITGLDTRMSTLERHSERKTTSWPAVASFILSAVMAVLFIAGLLYIGPH